MLIETTVLDLNAGSGQDLLGKECHLLPALQSNSERSLPQLVDQSEADCAAERCLSHRQGLAEGKEDRHHRAESLPVPV